jgi:hypothetical protein
VSVKTRESACRATQTLFPLENKAKRISRDIVLFAFDKVKDVEESAEGETESPRASSSPGSVLSDNRVSCLLHGCSHHLHDTIHPLGLDWARDNREG